MEKNRNPELIYNQLLFDKQAKFLETGQSLQQMVLGELDVRMQKYTMRSLPYILFKNQLQMDQRPKCMT